MGPHKRMVRDKEDRNEFDAQAGATTECVV
jgi:hypothetical protein